MAPACNGQGKSLRDMERRGAAGRSWAGLRCLAVTAALLAAGAGAGRAGQVELISRAATLSDTAAGGAPFANSSSVSVSADGRYVVFVSTAVNLVPGQVDAQTRLFPYFQGNVFLHDRVSGTTILVNHAPGAATTTANSSAAEPAMSADGRYVVFTSDATNLVPGQNDANDDIYPEPALDVFLFDRVTGTVVLVSHAAGATATTGNAHSAQPVVSADGSQVVFSSRATDLVPGQSDGNGQDDLFLYDRALGKTALVSRASASAATAGNGHSDFPSLSADGRYVAFASTANDLVAGQVDGNGGDDVFLYDRLTTAVRLVSRAHGTATTAGNAGSFNASISADGSRIAFDSDAGDLIAGMTDGGAGRNVFLYDVAAGTATLVSHAAPSPTTTGNGFAAAPHLAAGGGRITFSSAATDLVSGQTGSPDPTSKVFLYDVASDTTALVSHVAGSPTAPVAEDVRTVYGISGDGRYVLFLSDARDLVAGQTSPPFVDNLFLYDHDAGGSVLVSHAASAAAAGNAASAEAALSAGASYVAFVSDATDLVPGVNDLNHRGDLFLYESSTATNQLVSRADPGQPGLAAAGWSQTYNLPSVRPFAAVSGDGRYVLFTSNAPNLVPDLEVPADGAFLFLFDRATQTTALASHAASSPHAARNAFYPALSADGRYVAFTSLADDLVAGQVDGAEPTEDVFLYDRESGTTTLVSHAASSPLAAGNGDSFSPSVSADGRYVVYTSWASNLVAGQTDLGFDLDVFLYDRVTGANSLVSHAAASPTTASNGPAQSPQISADGAYVVFTSEAVDLGPDMTGADEQNTFLYDRDAGTTLSRIGPDATYAIDADGGFVALAYRTSGTQPEISNVYVYDRTARHSILVSRSAVVPNAAADGDSDEPAISADGRFVAFASEATDLVPAASGPGLPTWNVFLYDRLADAVTQVTRTFVQFPGSSSDPAISADGSHVVFLSSAQDIVPGQSGSRGVFLYDRATGTTALASRTSTSATTVGNGSSYAAVPSADGRVVAFTSEASDLVPGDFNLHADVFVYSSALGAQGSFFTLPPCRLLDTRQAGQGPALASGAEEVWTLHGTCGIPATARAVAVNVTVTQATAAGHLTLFAGDLAAPATSTINFGAGQTRANNAVLPLATNGAGTLGVRPFVLAGGTVHLIVDVAGYFE
jgi:Tol biopolymer transport system component